MHAVRQSVVLAVVFVDMLLHCHDHGWRFQCLRIIEHALVLSRVFRVVLVGMHNGWLSTRELLLLLGNELRFIACGLRRRLYSACLDYLLDVVR